MTALAKRFAALETQFENLKNKKISSTIAFGQLNFRRLEDAAAFVERHSPTAIYFGLIVDLHCFCSHIALSMNGQSGSSKKLKESKELNMTDLNESTHLAALACPIPGLFSDPTSTYLSWNDSAFSRYKTWKSWDEDGKDTIPTNAVQVREGLLQQIEGRYHLNDPSTAELRRICTLSVLESSANLHAMVSWLTLSATTFNNMGMTKDTAWSLATRLGEAYFRELHTVRVGVLNTFSTAGDVESKKQRAAQIWNVVGRTQDIMHQFYAKDFKNHEAISHEMTNYILRASLMSSDQGDSGAIDKKFAAFKASQSQSFADFKSSNETKHSETKLIANETKKSSSKADAAEVRARASLVRSDVIAMLKPYKKE